VRKQSSLQGLFVTGVDTGVGKTVVGAAILSALVHRGLRPQAKKPVESACARNADGALIPADAVRLWEASGRLGRIDQVCKHALAPLAAPDRAARLSGISLRIADLAAFCRECAGDADFLLVEGAGGFYSPLADDGLNADLAEVLGLPVLIVALDRLGCINQVLLTAEAIRRRGLTLAGAVLNVYPAPPEGDMDNVADLSALLNAPLFRFSSAEGPEFLRLIEHLSPRLPGSTTRRQGMRA